MAKWPCFIVHSGRAGEARIGFSAELYIDIRADPTDVLMGFKSRAKGDLYVSNEVCDCQDHLHPGSVGDPRIQSSRNSVPRPVPIAFVYASFIVHIRMRWCKRVAAGDVLHVALKLASSVG
jgi:hypothetical protein